MDLAIISFRNEVAVRYSNEKKNYMNQRLPKGQFDEIVKEVRKLRNFSDDVTASKATIDRRFQRDNLILHSSNGGKVSPLAKYKPYFVDMIIKLARCRHSITCSEGLGLINSLIQKKEIQNEVIQ